MSSAAVLFAVTILAFFLLYHRVYLPAPIQVRSEQERFDSFAAQYELSSREREILQLVLAGRSNPEMAGNLYISESTVKFHIHNLLKKTGCENRNRQIWQRIKIMPSRLVHWEGMISF